jgi:cytochrome c-type biogenesis protein CcmH
LAACLAVYLAWAAWRRTAGTVIMAGLGAVALACGVGAWVLRADTVSGLSSPPEAMLLSSALAFNKPGMPAAGAAVTPAGPLPELAGRLAARLAVTPGDAQGWSLLAASYRQLGRDSEAAAAEQRAIEAGADPATIAATHPQLVGPALAPASPMTTQPAGAAYVIEGQRLKIQRRFQEAQLQFQKAVEVDPLDADSWADLADCASAAAGNDLTAGQDAIARALAINPRHRKALWLQASLALQEGRYTAAAENWRTLSALVVPGSPDARVIAANIVEADSLAARTGG